MEERKYERCLSWALEQGLQLDERIERKQVNGVYGMYAKQPIPKNTILASFPKKRLIPARQSNRQSPNFPEAVKRLHAAAIEIEKGERSKFYGCVGSLESYEALRSHSFYFFTETELQFVQRLNPVLFQLVQQSKFTADSIKQYIKQADASISEEVAVQTALNSFSRSWGNSGFIPVLDLFNHSDKKGRTLKIMSGDRVGHVSAVDYQAGEQVFVSYSRKDLMSQTILFNYFDETDIHFIDYSARAIQFANTELESRRLSLLAQHYPMQEQKHNGVSHYRLLPQELFFMEQAPTLKLVEFFQISSIQSASELQRGRATHESIRSNLLSTLDAFLNANRVEDISLDEVPEKLRHFYHMQVKERQMLIDNRDWVLDQF